MEDILQKLGDIIFFDWADSNDGQADHVGIVEKAENGKVYSGAIRIDKTTALRARAYKDGMLFSEILTGSYISRIYRGVWPM